MNAKDCDDYKHFDSYNTHIDLKRHFSHHSAIHTYDILDVTDLDFCNTHKYVKNNKF